MKKSDVAIHARDSKQLGVAVSRFRRSESLTQEKLAELAGVLQKTVSAAERGVPGTQAKSIFKLLAALNLEVVVQRRGT